MEILKVIVGLCFRYKIVVFLKEIYRVFYLLFFEKELKEILLDIVFVGYLILDLLVFRIFGKYFLVKNF